MKNKGRERERGEKKEGKAWLKLWGKFGGRFVAAIKANYLGSKKKQKKKNKKNKNKKKHILEYMVSTYAVTSGNVNRVKYWYQLDIADFTSTWMDQPQWAQGEKGFTDSCWKNFYLKQYVYQTSQAIHHPI